ncbi:MAG: adenosylcobinamide-GDP ribazoletransferase [Fibrobacterota bacterium]|nr:adenosylcobinamide-GDP ribazoletransferase [Fibrobacterota bacterium]QQS06732.1 MAG: adenosylcobinamide-GDP ribazoletransferase [Fibrobacterota bacterium]
MNPFWLAWSFLTVLPAPGQKVATSEEFVRSRVWYPAVGVALGGLWGGAAWLAMHWGVPSGLGGALLLAVILFATGFLHFDGLLDSADALLAPRSPQRRLEILKDVHMGSFAFGVGGLWLIASWQILSMHPDWRFLVALPVLSRAALLGPIHLFPYARAVDSSSLDRSAKGLAWRWIFPVLFATPAVWLFPAQAGTVVVIQLAGAWWASRKLGGGITGDIYGALLCMSELGALIHHALGASR